MSELFSLSQEYSDYSAINDITQTLNYLISHLPKLHQKLADLIHIEWLNTYIFIEIDNVIEADKSNDYIYFLIQFYEAFSKENSLEMQIYYYGDMDIDSKELRSLYIRFKGFCAYKLLSQSLQNKSEVFSYLDKNTLNLEKYIYWEVIPEVGYSFDQNIGTSIDTGWIFYGDKKTKIVDIVYSDLEVRTYIPFKKRGNSSRFANKTEAGVQLTYLPYLITVRCDFHRSQHVNYSNAIRLLACKIYETVWKSV